NQTTVTIELIGTAPVDFKYKDAKGKIFEVNNYSDDTYLFQTNQLTTFEMVSVSDSFKPGIVQGSATISLAPKASATLLTENIIKCPGEVVELGIDLTGTSPYSFTLIHQYEENGDIAEEIVEIDEINETPYIYQTSEPGIYYLTSMNDANCEGSVNPSIAATIENYSTPTAILSGGGSFCSGDAVNLDIAFTGTAPWNITYSNPANETVTIEDINDDSFKLEVTASGKYQLITVNDANCEGSASGDANVTINEKPTASISGGGDICGDVGGVDITFNLSGNAPFDIVYTNGIENFTVNDITENTYQVELSEVGTYTLVSVQDKFCTGTVSGEALVERNNIPSVTFNIDQQDFCADAAAIQLTATPAGGTFSGPGVSGEQFDPAAAGVGTHTISYSFTSETGCSNSASNEVEVNALPTAIISGGGDVCGPSDPADISVALTGTAPFAITYSDGTSETTVEDINSTTYTFTTDQAGAYSLISVADANGCDGDVSGEAIVNVITEEINLEIVSGGSLCEGEELTLQANYNTESITWSTTGEGTISDANADEITYTPAEGETGEITFSVTTSNVCTSETIEETVTITPLPEAGFSTSPADKLIYVDVEFFPDITDADSYNWEFGDGETSNEVYPIHAYDQANNYEVTLTVENDGCENSSSVTVVIGEQRVIYVPNIFSPAAVNPENQVVKVYGEGIASSDFLFKVVNRWGGTLFETNSLDLAQNSGWDGRANNGEMQTLGTYTYIVKGKFLDGETFEKIGTVTLAK
ncbi:MAG: PKD domain-containing protein, partial [Cyclobacteriaceae bacterium]